MRLFVFLQSLSDVLLALKLGDILGCFFFFFFPFLKLKFNYCISHHEGARDLFKTYMLPYGNGVISFVW